MVDTMNGTKSPLASKTIWGGILALLGALAPVVLPQLGVPASDVQTLMASIATVAGAVIAIIGRFTATKPLA